MTTFIVTQVDVLPVKPRTEVRVSPFSYNKLWVVSPWNMKRVLRTTHVDATNVGTILRNPQIVT